MKTKLKILISISTVFVCLVYMGFLLGSSTLQNANELNENSNTFSSKTGRKILSMDLGNYKHPRAAVLENCSRPTILEFPTAGFRPEQRQKGWIILYMVVLLYGFLFLSTICDDYLVPSMEQICSHFNIDQNVLGATIMAAAVFSPELFMNFIGTFMTKSGIGVSTIMGSAIFRVLAVPGCCGIFLINYLQLDGWPITTDCLMYLLTILALVFILNDGQVWWYEALGLMLAYLGYMLVRYHSRKISGLAKRSLRKLGYGRPQYTEVTELTCLLGVKGSSGSKFSLTSDHYGSLELNLNESSRTIFQQGKEEIINSPWSRSNENPLEFVLLWPLTFLLWLTMPHARKFSYLNYLTVFLSLLWIAGLTYVLAFVTTAIGDTFDLPDAVMGLTVLGSGMSLPEAVSSIIVTRQGQGYLGLSNSLGTNTFDILLSLGLPWFIKAFFFPHYPDQKFLYLNAFGLKYVTIMLVASLAVLYLLLLCHKFALNRRLGFACLVMYISLIVLTTLVELNVFFPLNLPKCRQ